MLRLSLVYVLWESTLFRLFKDELLSEGIKPEQIISINFEELEYEHLRDYHALYQYILERMQPDEMNYIFLDEIQHVDQFHRVVDSLFVKEKYRFIYYGVQCILYVIRYRYATNWTICGNSDVTTVL